MPGQALDNLSPDSQAGAIQYFIPWQATPGTQIPGQALDNVNPNSQTGAMQYFVPWQVIPGTLMPNWSVETPKAATTEDAPGILNPNLPTPGH